jgi:hypothetical protein
LLLLSGCTSASRFVRIGDPQPARPEDCSIQVFKTEKPSRQFVRVARLDVHIEQAVWSQPTLDDALPELRKQACLAGADAVIEIEELKGGYLETRMLHVVATGIRWRAP